ncbi:hypothetical protein L7F22_006172 [Adiantum nelumboides]|nr:hypothetical protein [Adiantum nelumboides]
METCSSYGTGIGSGTGIDSGSGIISSSGVSGMIMISGAGVNSGKISFGMSSTYEMNGRCMYTDWRETLDVCGCPLVSLRRVTPEEVSSSEKNQVPYWAAYMQRFQVLREEWEKLVWDPIPIPPPKRRQPTWLAEETEKYVWQDPRREAFVASRNATQDPTGSAYTFDLSRMDRSAVREKFDEKIGYKRQAMSHSPYENRRDPGASGARPLHQRNVDFTRRKLRPTEFMDFDDVFNNEDDNKDSNKSHSHATEDEDVSEEALFSWDESDSEEDAGDKWEAAGQDDEDGFVDGARDKAKAAGKDEDDDEDSVDGESEVEDFQTDKKGWFGAEDDLFKDDE